MRLVFAVAVAFLCSSVTLHAQTETWTWKGQCKRGARTANATFTLKVGLSEIKGGTLNGKAISGLDYDEGTGDISFNAPGIFDAQEILRRFAGRINEDDGQLRGTLSQDDGKFANCQLGIQQ